jgi:hypothetical protein
MVEQVKTRTLYHVTATKPYKNEFAANQVVKVGDTFNPFFAFYEGSREYGVTQPDGSVLQIKAVAFLRQVRDGQINSPQFAAIATEVALHYVMLVRELIMEEIRREEFGCAPPSRQRCLYLCDTLDEARYLERQNCAGWSKNMLPQRDWNYSSRRREIIAR